MSLKPPPPQAIVLFGASGDLTKRKVMPALYNLAREGVLPAGLAIVGYARSPMDDDAFREQMRDAVEDFSRTPIDREVWERFAASLSYIPGEFETEDCMKDLGEHLLLADKERGTEGRRLFYCATPPSAFPQIARRLGEIGVGYDARIVIEKPFGHDMAGARALNDELHAVFPENRIFRIDHYLGKETVQNLLVLRFANAMFERVWNRDAIHHVEITVAESGGIGSRAGYYEQAGAVRDIVQNHMLQVLTFLAMEPPRSFDAMAIHDEKVKLLHALRPFRPEGVVRGQYTAGNLDGERVRGYRDEEGVDSDSTVETYVAIRAAIDNWRWDGVPFLLRTGKRLARRATEITVVFRQPPAYLFESMGVECPPSNHLSIRIQPSEGASFAFQAKEPGPRFNPRTVRMDFSYEEFFQADPADAYERLLYDAMVGDGTLFPREDGVERSWEIVEPILDDPGEIEFYGAGSWGPHAADRLIAPFSWHLR